MAIPVPLTPERVCERLHERHGIVLAPQSWRRYVYGGKAPKPDSYVGRTPVWRAAQVDDWAKSRPKVGEGGGVHKHREGCTCGRHPKPEPVVA